MCGKDRLWAFERVIGATLEGFETKEVFSVQSRIDCERACLIETEFTCRSVQPDTLRLVTVHSR